MKTLANTSQFKKDVKLMKKRGKNFEKFKQIIENLVMEIALDERYRDHALIGQYKGTRECHIEPDWLLIYETAETEIVLIRTGSHADLF